MKATQSLAEELARKAAGAVLGSSSGPLQTRILDHTHLRELIAVARIAIEHDRIATALVWPASRALEWPYAREGDRDAITALRAVMPELFE